jgi:hypothetical protein
MPGKKLKPRHDSAGPVALTASRVREATTLNMT